MRSKMTAAGSVLAAFVLAAASVAAAAKPNFSGTWVLDAAKSEGVMQGLEETMTVKQDGDGFVIEAKMKTQRGERTRNETFAADGKEGEFTMRMGPNESKGKRTAKWSADGNSLEVAESMTFQDREGANVEAKATRKWTLSADGKTLTVEESRTGGMRAGQSKRVYVKQ